MTQTLLDLDTENKARGSFAHFYGTRVPKLNIHTPAGLDHFIDCLTDGGAPVILADMGAGSGQVTYDWFETMYPDVAAAGIPLRPSASSHPTRPASKAGSPGPRISRTGWPIS